MQSLFQQLVNGTIRGVLFALVGVGFSITYGVSRILNFAHGAFVVAGAYATFALHDTFGSPPIVAVALGGFLVLPVAAIVYFVTVRPFAATNVRAALLGTFACATIILESCRIVFGARARIMPRLVNRPPLKLGTGVYVPVDTLLLTIAMAVVTVASIIALRSGLGRRLRAVVQDSEAAELIGIRPSTLRAFSFLFGALLGAAGGSALAMQGPINGQLAVRLTFVSFVAVVLAGFGNVRGAAIVGLLIGICQALSVMYVDPQFADATPFVVMAAVLLVRPTGLFRREA